MTTAHPQRPVAGIFWMVVTGLCFICVTALVKHMGPRLPSSEAAFIRYGFGLVFLLPAIGALREAKLSRRQWALFSVRGGLHGVGVILWFYAMTRISIAEVTAMNYLAPIYVTIGAALFLGESLALRRIIAVVLGLVGAAIILAAVGALAVQLYVSIRDRKANEVFAGDPWNGRTLEWFTSSPPPEYNFAVVPEVTQRDAFAVAKAYGDAYQMPPEFEDIEMPRNTSFGLVLSVAAAALGFGLTFYIWWLAGLSLLVIVGGMIARSFVMQTERLIPAAQVEADYRRWIDAVHAAAPVTRDQEGSPQNRGHAVRELPEGVV